MPAPVIAAAAAPVAGAVAGKVIGGGGPKNAQPALPKDLQGMRAGNIGLLNYLLGFNQPGAPWNTQPQQQVPASQGGPMQRGQIPGQHGAGGGGQTPYPWLNQSMNNDPAQSRPGMPGYGGGLQNGLAGLLGGGGGMSTGMMSGFGQGSSGPMQANPGTGGFSAQGQAMFGGGAGINGRLGIDPNSPQYAAAMAQQRLNPYAPMSFNGAAGPGVGSPQPGVQRMPGGTNPVLRTTGGGTPASAYPGFNSTYGMQPGGGFSSQLPQTPSDPNSMLGRMESYFGPLGTPTTALQQQSLGGISQFLNSNPYGRSNDFLNQVGSGSGYNEANQAYRDIGNTNYGAAAGNAFGQAGDMFKGVGSANYFGDAQNAFKQLGQGNYFGNAEGVFNRLEGFNPFGAAQTSMEGILAQNPGMQGMEALRPLLDRNLAAANQTGGRFGSANAILRSRAVDDNNMLAAQMYQRGVDQQIGAAGQYGQMGNSLIGARNAAGQGLLGVGQGRMQQQTNAAQGQLGVGQGRLSQGLGAANGMLGVGQGQLGVGQLGLQGDLGSAGGLAGLAQALQGDRLAAAGGLANNQNSLFGNMAGAYGIGSAQANQEAQRQQQALQILLGQLGVSQGATLGVDNVVSPTGAQQGAQFGSQFASLIPLLMAQGGGGGGNTWGPASQYGFGR